MYQMRLMLPFPYASKLPLTDTSKLYVKITTTILLINTPKAIPPDSEYYQVQTALPILIYSIRHLQKEATALPC